MVGGGKEGEHILGVVCRRLTKITKPDSILRGITGLWLISCNNIGQSPVNENLARGNVTVQ